MQTWQINKVITTENNLGQMVLNVHLSDDKPNLTPYKEYIRANEGVRKSTYKDTVGIKTVGVGFNLEEGQSVEKLRKVGFNDGEITELMSGKRTLLTSQVEQLFDLSLEQAHKDVVKLVPNFEELPFEVRKVLMDMSYNLGYTRLAKFRKMLSAAKGQDYLAMGAEIKDSNYYHQLPERANKNILLVTRLA